MKSRNLEFMHEMGEALGKQKFFVSLMMINIFVCTFSSNVFTLRIAVVVMGFCAITSTAFVEIFKKSTDKALNLAGSVIDTTIEHDKKVNKLFADAKKKVEEFQDDNVSG